MSNALISNLTNIILAFVAIVSISTLFIQLRQNDRSLRFQVLQGIVEILEDSTKERKALEKIVIKDNRYDVLKHPRDHKKFRKLIRAWDKIAAFTKYKAVPRKFVLDFYSSHIVRSFQYLEPLLEKTRKERNQDLYRSKFQKLASLAVEHRKDKYPEEAENLPEVKILEKEWKEWEKIPWFM